MKTAKVGPDLRLLLPMWWKENSDKVNKMHI